MLVVLARCGGVRDRDRRFRSWVGKGRRVDKGWRRKMTAGRLQILEYQNCADPGGVEAPLAGRAGRQRRIASRYGWRVWVGFMADVFRHRPLRPVLLRGINGVASGASAHGY